MGGQRGVAHAHLGDLREGGLQRGQQLGLELVVELAAGIGVLDVAADVGVEQDGVGDAVGVLAEAADGDVDVDAGALVHDAERDGGGGAVLVADDLLGVEVVDALILGDLAAEGKALAEDLEGLLDGGAEVAREDRGLGGGVVAELTRLGAELGDLAVVDDDHALAVGHGDDGAVGDDVVIAPVALSGVFSLALDDERLGVERLAVEILLPLVGQYAVDSAQTCLNKTHLYFSFRLSQREKGVYAVAFFYSIAGCVRKIH